MQGVAICYIACSVIATPQNNEEASYGGMATRIAKKNFYRKGKKLFSFRKHLCKMRLTSTNY
jgi:hypothetical protein